LGSFNVPIYIVLRFSTRTELVLTGLSLIAAIAAGAAQVRLSFPLPFPHACQPSQLTDAFRSLS
jgi:hypothetical protein